MTGKRAAAPSGKYLTLSIFFACLTLSVSASVLAYFYGQSETRDRFNRGTQSFINAVQERLNVYTNALVYTRNLFDLKPTLSQAEFSEFIRGMRLAETYPGVQNVGFVERLPKAEAARKLKELGLHTLEEFKRPTVDLVTRLERLDLSGSNTLGIDLGVTPERLNAMDLARDLGIPVASDRVRPFNAGPSEYAVLFFVPKYKNGLPTATVEQRRRAHIGFVYAGFRAKSVFGRIVGDTRMGSISLNFAVYDGDAVDPAKVLFEEVRPKREDPNFIVVMPIKSANHLWTIRMAAPIDYQLGLSRWTPVVLLSFGLFLSVVIAAAFGRAARLASELRADIEARQAAETALVSAREEADQANRAKTIFLANISHEIRTPLGIINGFAEVGRNEAGASELGDYFGLILRNGRELLRIIGEVLDLSKIEANRLQIEESAVDVEALLRDLDATWGAQAKSKELTFTFDLDALVPESVLIDGVRLRQILTNLVSNAVKFTASGFVRVHATVEGAALAFSVTDSGIGIDPSSRQKLFRPFSQADDTITRKFGGSGLGLALSSQLARAMGGHLELTKSVLGEGSRFELKLPLKRALPTPAAPPETPASLEGRRILVVDDAPDNQVLLKRILGKLGAIVTTADNGQQGIDATFGANPPELILMDLQMPVLDGYSALAELLRRGLRQPVVALTAHAMADEKARALDAGFAAYCTKPIDRAHLTETIARLLGPA